MTNKPVLLITGGSRGIGAATAILAAASGYDVCLTYRENKAAADKVLSSIRNACGTAIAVKTDTCKPQDVDNLFSIIDRELGSLSALVNNAAISGDRVSFLDLKMNTLRQVLEVNVTGYFHCAQQAASRMAKSRGGKGGSIVNVSSQAAVSGGFRLSHYAASKGAINSFTVGLAAELASENIRVNAVSPGIIDTDQLDSSRIDKAIQTIPLGRVGTASEVAKTILWLLSNDASYITGAILPVAGGR